MLQKIILLVVISTFSNQLFAEWTHSSKLTFDYYYDSVSRSKYTQTKPSLLVQNEQFKFEFSYLLPEQNPPEQSFIDYKSSEYFNYLLSYQYNDLMIRYGKLHTSLGKGLTFNNSINLKDIGVDSNLLGSELTVNSTQLNMKVFYGEIYNSFYQSREVKVSGYELSKRLVDNDWYSYTLGTTFVDYNFEEPIVQTPTNIFETIQPLASNDRHAFSVYHQLYYDFGSLYYEYATTSLSKKSNAHYVSSDVYIQDSTVTFQYSHYEQFNLSHDNNIFQLAPTALKTYPYTLPNKVLYSLNVDESYVLNRQTAYGVTYYTPLIEDSLLEISWSQENDRSETKYSDVYAQLDYMGFDSLEFKTGYGVQYLNIVPYNYINIIEDIKWNFYEDYSFNTILEHQTSGRENLTRVNRYSMTFMLSKAQLGSISFLREGSDLSNSVWDGTQIDWLINSRSSMRVFVGKRQAGQRCIGGVCRAFPEFDGIEFGLVYSL